MIDIKDYYLCKQYLKLFSCVQQMGSNSFKIKLSTNYSLKNPLSLSIYIYL